MLLVARLLLRLIRELKKKVTKDREFPGISWGDNSHPDIQLCLVLYDDRVRTWHDMQHFDFLLDGEVPTAELCGAMVEADIRNRQADDELLYYQKHKAFLGVHPLVVARNNERKIFKELYELQKNNPAEFVEAIANNVQNIRRIESRIEQKRYSNDEQLSDWEKNLERARLRKEIIGRLIAKS